MISILSLLVVVTLSILLSRVATIALVHTGLSKESARFQARSALTGAGFTTTESERVVGHPVRRRIILLLMLLGNAGVVTAVASLILTFVGQDQVGALPIHWKVLMLIAGLTVLWALAMSEFVDRHLSRAINWALSRYTDLDVRDYASLMQLSGDYRVVELPVEDGDWIAGKTLADSRLRDEGVVVLAIRRPDEAFVGAPSGESRVSAGDTLIAYGRIDALQELDVRRRGPGGDLRHAEAALAHSAEQAGEGAGD